jgi:hypothetical protein
MDLKFPWSTWQRKREALIGKLTFSLLSQEVMQVSLLDGSFLILPNYMNFRDSVDTWNI